MHTYSKYSGAFLCRLPPATRVAPEKIGRAADLKHAGPSSSIGESIGGIHVFTRREVQSSHKRRIQIGIFEYLFQLAD